LVGVCAWAKATADEAIATASASFLSMRSLSFAKIVQMRTSAHAPHLATCAASRAS
jgi:hypothetical protein